MMNCQQIIASALMWNGFVARADPSLANSNGDGGRVSAFQKLWAARLGAFDVEGEIVFQ